jgi:hypothetical protein
MLLSQKVAVHQLVGQRAGIALFLPGKGGGELVGEAGQPLFGGRLPGADTPGPGGDDVDQAVGGGTAGIMRGRTNEP